MTMLVNSYVLLGTLQYADYMICYHAVHQTDIGQFPFNLTAETTFTLILDSSLLT